VVYSLKVTVDTNTNNIVTPFDIRIDPSKIRNDAFGYGFHRCTRVLDEEVVGDRENGRNVRNGNMQNNEGDNDDNGFITAWYTTRHHRTTATASHNHAAHGTHDMAVLAAVAPASDANDAVGGASARGLLRIRRGTGALIIIGLVLLLLMVSFHHLLNRKVPFAFPTVNMEFM